MKLLKLEILNLASLDKIGGEVINFEEGVLGESTIFSIVGPTGSGKSTILDAICLALYNRAPRYPRKKGDKDRIEVYGEVAPEEKNRLAPTDGRNILSRGRKFGYSKLTFLANNGTVYRAEWSVRMKVKNYEDAVTSLFRMVEKEGRMEEESASWEELPQIIGLDYEQFLRTVLIAQGSFANFLTAKENERYELLEKLVGCEDMYTRIADEVKVRKDETSVAFNEIKANFMAFEKDDLTQEQLEELNRRIDELEFFDKKRKEDLEKVKKALAWYESEEKQTKDLQGYRQMKEEAQKALEAMKEQSERLAKHDVTLQAVAYYREWKEKEKAMAYIGKELVELNAGIVRWEESIKEEENILAGLVAVAGKAEKAWEEQRPRINRARTLKGELEVAKNYVQEKEKDVEKAYKDKNAADKAVLQNRKAIGNETKELENAEKEYIRLYEEVEKRKGKLQTLVTEAKEAYETERKKLEGRYVEVLQLNKDKAVKSQHELKEAVRVLRDKNDKQEKKLQNTRGEQALLQRNQQIEAEGRKLDVEVLESELTTLRRTHTLMTSEDWVLHRRSLTEGKPCPLCGSLEHPYRKDETFMPVMDDLLRLMADKEATLSERKKRREELTGEWSENKGKLHTIQTHQEILDKEIGMLQQEWTGIVERHPDWQAEEESLQRMIPGMDEAVRVADEALRVYQKVSDAVEKLRKDKEKKEETLTNYVADSERELKKADDNRRTITIRLETEKGKTENLLLQQKEKLSAFEASNGVLKKAQEEAAQKTENLKAEIGDKDPDDLERELTEARTLADKNVTDKKGRIEELKRQLEGNRGSVRSKKEQQEKERMAKEESDAGLDEWLSAYNRQEDAAFSFTREDIAGLYAASDDWEEIRKEKERRSQTFTRANTTFVNAEKAYQKHLQGKPEEEKAVLEIRKVELEEKDMNELVEAKARLQRYERAKKEMGVMHEAKQQAEQTLTDWMAISDAIGGADGKLLRKIAQCYTLKFLIEHANAEIRKFNSRYELQQVKHSLGIRIIDHDRADDVRDTTSLSGGETFIVSLGLALGLSSLSSRNISFENLFIDEGFGTLDPDTLATVIDSLAMLQSSQGKKVGVISHTDTMSERITTQIRVIRNGDSGSSRIEIFPN